MVEMERLLKPIRDTHFLSESTKESYLRFLTRAREEVFCKGKRPCSLHRLLMNPVDFTDRLEAHAKEKGFKDHWKDFVMSSVLAVWNYNPTLKEKHPQVYAEWMKQKRRVSLPIDLKYKSQEPTERQKKAYVPWEEICRARDALRPGSQERLLLMIYTEIPPVRSDYDRTRIYASFPRDEDETGNYIVVNKRTATVVLQEYKTAKRYDKIRIPLPEVLVQEIDLSLQERPRDYLFTNYRNLPFTTPKMFNAWANKTLREAVGNKDIGLTTLRHIYISRKDLKIKEMRGIDQDKIARIMGHSIAMQRGYLWD